MLVMAAYFLLILFVSAALAANCSVGPVFVDIHSRETDDNFNFQYGLFIGVGTPSQNQSLWPSLGHNESTFSDDAYCNTSPFAQCSNQTHGFYTPLASQTFQNDTDLKSLDNDSDIASNVDYTGTDDLNLYTHYFDPSPPNMTVLANYPVTVLTGDTESTSPWFSGSGRFGIGPSSTALQALYDMGLIASRSFGLYLGAAYPRAGGQVNGSLVLGGYDSGRFQEPLYEYTQSAMDGGVQGSTPFKVSVATVTLTTGSHDTSTDINDTPFDAYLTTSQHGLSLPQSAVQRFIDLTHATTPTTNIFGDDSLALPSDFAGSLTITLSSGLNVTIPPAVLRNASNLSPIISASNSSTASPPLLGSVFLSYVYLFAQFDSDPPSFSLAHALQSGTFVVTEPLCPSTVPTVYHQAPISTFASSGLIGAVLGGVIGGVGITFAVWFCLRRHFVRKERRENGFKSEESVKKVDKSRNPVQSWRRKHQNGPSKQQQKQLSWDETEVDEEAGVDLQPYQASTQRDLRPDSTAELGRRGDVYANIPLTPKTPLPLLSVASGRHKRSNSDDRRREMGLAVKTDFAPPPRKGLSPRTGEGLKIEKHEVRGVSGKKSWLFGRKK